MTAPIKAPLASMTFDEFFNSLKVRNLCCVLGQYEWDHRMFNFLIQEKCDDDELSVGVISLWIEGYSSTRTIPFCKYWAMWRQTPLHPIYIYKNDGESISEIIDHIEELMKHLDSIDFLLIDSIDLLASIEEQQNLPKITAEIKDTLMTLSNRFNCSVIVTQQVYENNPNSILLPVDKADVVVYLSETSYDESRQFIGFKYDITRCAEVLINKHPKISTPCTLKELLLFDGH